MTPGRSPATGYAPGWTRARTGMRVGSPQFMAPEQIAGDAVTPAIDIFALGALAAYAATARPAFGEGTQAVVMYRVVHEVPNLEGCLPPLRGLAGSVTSFRSPSSVVMPICTRSIFTGSSAACSRDDSLTSLTRLVSAYSEMFDILPRRLAWRSWPGLIQQRGCRPTGS